MADEAGETNTAVEDGEAKQAEEPEVLGDATVSEASGDGRGQKEKPVAESSWSAPILSLARKATETISSGVSYGAALRHPSTGSTASSPTEKEPENDSSSNSSASKILPGRLRLLFQSVGSQLSDFHLPSFVCMCG